MDLVETQRATLIDYRNYMSDMYVCFSTREKDFINEYGPEKERAIEMRTPLFFLYELQTYRVGRM